MRQDKELTGHEKAVRKILRECTVFDLVEMNKEYGMIFIGHNGDLADYGSDL